MLQLGTPPNLAERPGPRLVPLGISLRGVHGGALMERQFTKLDFENLIDGEWDLIGSGLQAEDAGLFLRNKVALGDTVWVHPYGKPGDPVLPFRFTAEQFKLFCDWHPTFQWEAIESVFTNDDGSIDHRNLDDLTRKCQAAVDLVWIGLGKQAHLVSLMGQHVSTEVPPANDEQGTTALWPLKTKIERDDGLATPIHTALKVAREAGRPIPNAREMLAYFELHKPKGILRVLADGCDYLDNQGVEQSVDLKKIGKRIAELTTRQRPKKSAQGPRKSR